MKLQNLLPVCFLIMSLTFTSCKKDSPVVEDNEIESTIELTTNQAIADNLVEDANDVMMQVAEEKDLTGNRLTSPNETSFLCATVTVTPLSGFPKTVVIDFGTGCTAPNGVTRSGIIRVVVSDSLRKPGSTAVMTFENYFVNGFKKEGTITWTNTSTAVSKSWRRQVVDGKITAPGGRFWLHSSIKEVVQVDGLTTPRLPFDDIFIITGNASVTNANNITRTSSITEPLQKKVSCRFIDRGRIRFQGPNHFAILDFGNGTCDNAATISIDGNPPRAITL